MFEDVNTFSTFVGRTWRHQSSISGGFNQCFSEASHVGKAMLGLAFLLLDFVRSFCQEYGAAWNWPKNGTRTAELVQKQQRQRRSWPAGEYASALDESFLRFFWPRPVHLFDTKHHCTLCKICTSYNCNAMLRVICYPCSWCNDIGSQWWQVHQTIQLIAHLCHHFHHFHHFHHVHHFHHFHLCLISFQASWILVCHSDVAPCYAYQQWVVENSAKQASISLFNILLVHLSNF